MRDLDCTNFVENINESASKNPPACVPVHLIPSNYGSEEREHVNGMLFLKVSYQPRPLDVFYPLWREVVHNISTVNDDLIDRFEHLNDFLSNQFIDSCQHGTLMIELNSVKIPKYMKTGEDGSGQDDIENLVFMLKIRVAKETRVILVGAPDQIYGDPNQRESIQIHSTVHSLRDVVYIEFYDVLNEEDFDPKVRQPMSNLRMLSNKTFEVKDLPFDGESFVEKYSVLMPVEYSKKVAEFNFTAQFRKSVPPELVARPLVGAPEGVPVTMGYVLTARTIFEK